MTDLCSLDSPFRAQQYKFRVRAVNKMGSGTWSRAESLLLLNVFVAVS